MSRPLAMTGFGCYGKLPVSREFVVEGPRSLHDSGFDRWLSEGVGLSKARLGVRFDALIRSFPHYRFVWNRGKDHQLAGVIYPGSDAASRQHPFALFGCFRGRGQTTTTTALQVQAMQETAADLLPAVTAADTPAAVREAIRATPPLDLTLATDAGERYRKFVTEGSCNAFWRELADRSDAGTVENPTTTVADARFTVLQAFVETLAPLKQKRNRAFRGGIRYPLSSQDSAQTALETCFWLDLTEAYLGRSLDHGSWFRASEGPVDNHHLFVFLSPPSGNQWVSLIDPGDDMESISYLDRPYGSEPPEQRMDPALRDLLTSTTSTFADYLNWASGT